MHLQKKILFDRDLWVKVTQNVAQYPLHHVPYAATELVVARSNGFLRRYIYKKPDGWTHRCTDGWMDDAPTLVRN